MWYYKIDDDRLGPFDAASIEDLISQGKICSDTLIQKDGDNDFQLVSQSVFSSAIESSRRLGSSTSDPAARKQILRSPLAESRKLDQWFRWFWVLLILGIATSFFVVGFFALIAAVVFSCLILHRLWDLIPAEKAKTSPNRAIIFLFVPFFNLYWNFIAVHGLAKSLNGELALKNKLQSKVDERISLAFGVTAIIAFIASFESPFVGAIISIVQGSLLLLTLKQMIDAAKVYLLNE